MTAEPPAPTLKCPTCAAPIPPEQPPFCAYCGATLPRSGTALPAHDATGALEARLAELAAADRGALRSSGSWTMLVVVVIVVASVFFLGCCAFLGVRATPG